MAKPFTSLSPPGDLTSPLISLRGRPPFTASQWQELETQALVFKYFVAGVPVPDDLLSAVRVSFESMAAARFYHQSSLGYGGYFGKKIDPEPGRCRRTDGKKWRCAKEAAPDSKYCERHMHRGRNRSRKPVESQQLNPNHNNHNNTTTITTANSNGSSNSGGTNLNQMNEARNVGIGSRGFGNPGNGNPGNGLYLNMDSNSYRYPYGVVKNIDEQSLFSEASGTLRCITMGSSQPSNHFSPYQLQNNNNNSFYNNTTTTTNNNSNNDNYSRNVVGPTKEHNLRHFFDENDYSFSSTQLSISIPMTGSEFSTPSSRSPDDD